MQSFFYIPNWLFYCIKQFNKTISVLPGSLWLRQTQTLIHTTTDQVIFIFNFTILTISFARLLQPPKTSLADFFFVKKLIVQFQKAVDDAAPHWCTWNMLLRSCNGPISSHLCTFRHHWAEPQKRTSEAVVTVSPAILSPTVVVANFAVQLRPGDSAPALLEAGLVAASGSLFCPLALPFTGLSLMQPSRPRECSKWIENAGPRPPPPTSLSTISRTF